jgi:Methyltransferase domain
VTTRHEFLAMLHEALKPRGYLEIGVFSGDSLRLVQRGTPAIGIDPDPHLHGHFPGSTHVARTTSDNYFAAGPPALEYVDLAFIDGMHLFEYALRDFMNVELHSNRRTVVVLDDVLPRNQHEAARDQCPGDWTGDVWKVPRILQLLRPDLQVILVDTQPTGTCVVFDLDRTSHRVQDMYDQMIAWGLDQWNTVPDEVLSREEAVQPAQALEAIEFYYRGLED